MATPVSLANVARIAAGVVAIVWALLGLGNALAAGTGRGFDASVIAAVVVNLALIVAAAFAFVRVRPWFVAMAVTAIAVTVDRLIGVVAAGDFWLGATSIAMLI